MTKIKILFISYIAMYILLITVVVWVVFACVSEVKERGIKSILIEAWEGPSND